jgi:hypothetical protein
MTVAPGPGFGWTSKTIDSADTASRTTNNWSANVDFWTWSNLLECCVLFRHGHSDQATAHNSLPDVVPWNRMKREAKANV